ncbi:MAG: hypothetical protein M3Q42_11085 [Pseudomonadota bacterium]|nr:hypothetical protein [Pseudomonadota bacterium]
MTPLLSIILPVLDGMPSSQLKHALQRTMPRHAEDFADIESGFRALTARRQKPELLRRFFQSWSQTNNSAMTVAGISNRLTLMMHTCETIPDPGALTRAIVSLNRIVDEDLAVTTAILHSKLFYAMATGIVGDDQWLLHRHIDPAAQAFKDWKDRNSLRERDPMVALLTTLVHEIYTHGEVEYILPLFRTWLARDLGVDDDASRRTLAWISVHCGPTEKNHFFHAVDAVGHYARAMHLHVEDYPIDEIVAEYLTRKAEVMRALFEVDRTVDAVAA